MSQERGCGIGQWGAKLTARCHSYSSQFFLPMRPRCNEQVAVSCESGKVVYVHGYCRCFSTSAQDLTSFRSFTSQMIANGNVRHSEIARTFGAPAGDGERYVKLYREKGAEQILCTAAAAIRGSADGEVKAQAQARLQEGQRAWRRWERRSLAFCRTPCARR